MDSKQSVTRRTVIEILKEISRVNPEITWKMNCCYSDGEFQTLYEIFFKESHTNKVMGRILYCMENARVVRMRYRGLGKIRTENIIDALLEVLYYQNHAVAV
jgi:hypothetical protein